MRKTGIRIKRNKLFNQENGAERNRLQTGTVILPHYQKEGVRKMNTQYNFLDNAVNDESELTGAKDMDTKMCSYPQNDTEDVCPTSQDATYRNGLQIGQERQNAG